MTDKKKTLVTIKNIYAYECDCDDLANQMKSVAQSLREFDEKWQSQARPALPSISNEVADLIDTLADRIAFSMQYERMFIDSQVEVHRLRQQNRKKKEEENDA